jgi:hypothetical protein
MRRHLYYSLLCLLWISMNSCKDDEVAAPPTPSFTVNKISGQLGDEFLFTVDQVDGNSISLLPYGADNPSAGGILIPKSSFTNGKATVAFKYGRVGKFNAVVVANNHSTDGNSVKNTVSDAREITISSSSAEITDFSVGILTTDGFAKDIFTSLTTKTTINKVAKTILLEVRYSLPKDSKNPNYFTDATKLIATYAVSGNTTVTVNGTAQKSGATENNFSNPVNYVVRAQDGTTVTYTVTAVVTPVETNSKLKAVSGVSTSKATDKRALPGSIDDATKKVVIYDVYGSAADKFDSVRVKYETEGSFATVKLGSKDAIRLKQDSLLNLNNRPELFVLAQDSTINPNGFTKYVVYGVAAPRLTLSFQGLNPIVTGANDNFSIKLSPLASTFPNPAARTIATTAVIDVAAGVNVTGIQITELSTVIEATPNGVPRAFTSGDVVDFTKDVKFELTVNDANIGATYKVVYTATVATK